MVGRQRKALPSTSLLSGSQDTAASQSGEITSRRAAEGLVRRYPVDKVDLA